MLEQVEDAQQVQRSGAQVADAEASGEQGEQEKGIGYAMRRATTFLRLFKGVKLWAEGRGAKRVMVHVTSGDNRGALGFRKAEKLLEKVRAQSIGGAFVL